MTVISLISVKSNNKNNNDADDDNNNFFFRIIKQSDDDMTSPNISYSLCLNEKKSIQLPKKKKNIGIPAL